MKGKMWTLKTNGGRKMALTYQINQKTAAYKECGYDETGLAKRKVLKGERDRSAAKRAPRIGVIPAKNIYKMRAKSPLFYFSRESRRKSDT